MSLKLPYKQEIITAILRAEPTVKQIFLFGSRVQLENMSLYSDIDIGIMAKKKLSFYQLAQLNDAIDRIDTLYTIELIDFTDRKDDFSSEALKNIEVLYEKNKVAGTIEASLQKVTRGS